MLRDLLSDALYRLRALFLRDRMEGELDEELRFHYESQLEANLNRGLSRKEAVRHARLAFGGFDQVKEDCRDVRGIGLVDTVIRDVTYALRQLAKSPGFTVVAVLSLALGIGATTAIFSLFDAIWLRPLPHPQQDRLVAVSEVELAEPEGRWGVAMVNYFDWKAQCKSFEYLTLVQMYHMLTLVGEDRSERITARRVTEGYLEIFGGEANLGRLFLPEEFEVDGPPTIVLSYALWQRSFGSDPGVLGTHLELERDIYTVVGVMSPTFETFGGDDIDMWIPINWRINRRNARSFPVIGRLAEGTDIQTAQAELDVVARRLAEEYPEQEGFGARVEPLRDWLYGSWGRRFVFFFIAVVLVLLIACANVANLMLVRAASREKEMAVRSSLGAGRPRLIRQVLCESTLLALVGAALGLLIAFVGVKLLIGINPDAVPRADEIGLNVRILSFTFLVVVLTSLLFGLVPALRASQPNLNESLKETARRSTAGLQGRRAHGVLVVVEIALSLVLLVGAGLMIRSVWQMLHVGVGFNTENLIVLNISLPMAQYIDFSDQRHLLPRAGLVREEIQQRLGALPGVRNAAVATTSPLAGCYSRVVSVGDQPLREWSSDQPWVCWHAVTADYFRTVQVPLLRGRGFTETDGGDSPSVAVVSESMAKRYFPTEDPIGKVLNLRRPNEQNSSQPPAEIVGVVADVRQSLFRQPTPAVYVPYSQMPAQFVGPNTGEYNSLSFVLSTDVEAASLEPSMRRVISGVAADVPVLNIRTMDDVRSLSTRQSRFYAWLLGVFAAVALLSAAIGVFGVMSYTVARRTHEIGIRMALGAHRPDVLKLVLRQGLRLTVVGLIIGLAAALGLTRFLASLLYEVTPTDTSAFAVAAVVLGVVAFVACLIPARRATKVDPMVALR